MNMQIWGTCDLINSDITSRPYKLFITWLGAKSVHSSGFFLHFLHFLIEKLILIEKKNLKKITHLYNKPVIISFLSDKLLSTLQLKNFVYPLQDQDPPGDKQFFSFRLNKSFVPSENS